MNKEYSEKAKDIGARLLEHPDENQEKLLVEWTMGEPGLGNEVRQFLSERKKARYFIEDLKNRIFSLSESTVSGLESVPERIGNYRIIRRIGEGGSATVYLAKTQTRNGEVEGALKVLHRDAASSDTRHRFEAERRILATLNHPGIARLLDGGITDDGDLYVVTEYIDGLPVDKYCDERRLTISQRLKLFRAVCESVEYAHRNLVVHRDIKPDHVLVTESGDIRLLDFGIAKLLEDSPSQAVSDDSGTGSPVLITRTNVRVMTPDFASPEQVTGARITTSSDVYSLGVLLYVLLTGQRPYRVGRSSLLEMERIICHSEPVRPSLAVTGVQVPVGKNEDPVSYDAGAIAKLRGTDPGKLTKMLSGDLDRIILMALRKEPERRYASVLALSEDIGRYLDGKPVRARPPEISYRAGKFIQRNKLTVAFAALALLAMLAGLMGTIWQAQQAKQQAVQAAIERDKAEQVSEFLVNMFRAGNPKQALGETITALDILALGVVNADALADQPEIQAHLYHIIGDTYFHMGNFELARPVLERGLELRMDLFNDTDHRLNDTRFLLATVLQIQGQHRDAVPLFNDIVSAWQSDPQSVLQGDPSRIMNLAHIFNARRDYITAGNLYRHALDTSMERLGRMDILTGSVLRYLADVEMRQGNSEAAEQYYREALDVFTSVETDFIEVASILEGLSDLAVGAGNIGQAIELLNSSIELELKLYGNDHGTTGVKFQKMANLHRDHNNLELALAYYELAENHLIRIFGDEHVLAGSVYIDKAVLAGKLDRSAEAENLFNKGMMIFREMLRPDHDRIALATSQYGTWLTSMNRFDEAEVLLLESYNIYKNRPPDNPITVNNLRQATSALVDLYEKWGRPGEAAPFRSAITVSM
ncbi:MAG: serine/threonine protein kinase [Balneolaceae bacterium]|nr:MAG: serine/threonine protein kinase [Balneolaceae bacterium]